MPNPADAAEPAAPDSAADDATPRFRVTLAPMQDVTTRGFMRLVARYGAPDWFVTEFFRVHATSRLDPEILSCITDNDTGRPVFAQIIGEDIPHMVRAARELAQSPAVGVDLNLGCPAPKVFRKNVGGGLLRDLPHVDALLGALRDTLSEKFFTVKTRIGFNELTDSPGLFDSLLALVNKHRVDLLTVHGRTVRGLYRSAVNYAAIAHAAQNAHCPVVANGDISSAEKAARVVAETGCAAVMAGRHAVRNPWIFRQIREHQSGLPIFTPTLGDVRAYIAELAESLAAPNVNSQQLAARMKKFLNFVGTGVDAAGAFLYAMRRADDADALFRVCDEHLVAGGRAALPFANEPFPNVTARPNCE